MGLDYAYDLVAERRDAERVIRAVAARLVPDDAGRLLACLPIDADGPLPLGRVERRPLEVRLGAALCLCFLFPGDDPHVRRYAATSKLPAVDGLQPVGCVWSTIQVAGRFVVFRAEAATSDMSRLFEQSPAVRATWAAIAADAGAVMLLLDDERFDFNVVWPVERRFDGIGRKSCGEGDDSSYLEILREIGDVIRPE